MFADHFYLEKVLQFLGSLQSCPIIYPAATLGEHRTPPLLYPEYRRGKVIPDIRMKFKLTLQVLHDK